MADYPGEYNYEHFDFAHQVAERTFWSESAPALGSTLADFELQTVEGNRWRLSEQLGKPVVIETGSYTCPIFCGRIGDMEALASDHPDVEFVVVYVREAHPGELTSQHGSPEDKLECARRLVRVERLARSVLVDTHDGAVHRSLGANYNSVLVLDAQGRVVLRRRWNEPSDVRRTLANIEAGIRPVPLEALNFGTACDRRPAGVEILERGGPQALADFVRNAPPGILQMLRASTDAVRAFVPPFGIGGNEA